METIIYNFSGTGNNLAIAKQLAAELGKAEIRSISELKDKKEIPKEFEQIIFTVPCYYSHVPPFVMKCMKNVVYTDSQRVCLIVGCAGNRGMAVQDMRKLVNASNKIVNLEYMVLLPGNFILSYNAFPMWYQKMTIKLSYSKIRKIAKEIKEKKVRKPLGKGFLYSSKFENSLQNSIASYPTIGQQFEVSDACALCQTCIKVCHVKNIEILNDKVTFGDQCNQCMACIQWCPKQAIDYQGKAKFRNRYHHLDIKLQDIIP